MTEENLMCLVSKLTRMRGAALPEIRMCCRRNPTTSSVACKMLWRALHAQLADGGVYRTYNRPAN